MHRGVASSCNPYLRPLKVHVSAGTKVSQIEVKVDGERCLEGSCGDAGQRVREGNNYSSSSHHQIILHVSNSMKHPIVSTLLFKPS